MQKQRAPRTVWTLEMVDELRRLRAQGLTATQIADRMGVDAKAVEQKCCKLKIKRGGTDLEGFEPVDFRACQGEVKTGNSEPEERHEEAVPIEETAGGASPAPTKGQDAKKRAVEDAGPCEEPRELERMTIGKLVALCGEELDTEIFVGGQPVRIVQYMERYDLEARCGAALVDLIT